MRFAIFCHSLVSDWNHGNAHFLRGIATEMQHLGHQVAVYEPADGWSRKHLLAEQGTAPLKDFRRAFPTLLSTLYDPDRIDLDRVFDDIDVVLVHEWNDPDFVAFIGRHRAKTGKYCLLFHDTHHRSVTAPHEMSRYDLQHYDGVLAFGEVIRRIYLQHGWARRAWTWHEAADVRTFYPRNAETLAGDAVWIGNWGDGERSEELQDYLIGPIASLGIQARVYGVRYPQTGRAALANAGIDYAGWIGNANVPRAFAEFRCTLHIPRRPYREQLLGIPTIRMFEALACGIPLVSLRWEDTERLFASGDDYLVVDNPREMEQALRAVLNDPDLALSLAEHGLATIRARHTCEHRVNELLEIVREIRGDRNIDRVTETTRQVTTLSGGAP